MPEKRTTYTIPTTLHRRVSCCRCGRRLHAGVRVTTVVRPGLAETRHAGTHCPRYLAD